MERHQALRFRYGAQEMRRTLDARYPCELDCRAAPRSGDDRLEERRDPSDATVLMSLPGVAIPQFRPAHLPRSAITRKIYIFFVYL